MSHCVRHTSVNTLQRHLAAVLHPLGQAPRLVLLLLRLKLRLLVEGEGAGRGQKGIAGRSRVAGMVPCAVQAPRNMCANSPEGLALPTGELVSPASPASKEWTTATAWHLQKSAQEQGWEVVRVADRRVLFMELQQRCCKPLVAQRPSSSHSGTDLTADCSAPEHWPFSCMPPKPPAAPPTPSCAQRGAQQLRHRRQLRPALCCVGLQTT